MSSLTAARYGKDNVRILKVDRDPSTGIQKCTEMTVCVLLAGDIETSYTQADNSVVVATDSTKNTIHILAKTTPINPPELFASTLATHFIKQYKHIHETFVKVVTHRWTRLEVDGKPHPHSFHRDGVETRNVDAHFSRTGGLNLRSSIVGLHVLKTTGSQFHGFVRDEYTTLKETWDRILSTEVDAVWEWRKFADLEDVRRVANEGRFDKAWELARYVTLKTFCEDNSASVQATMYKMAQEIIAKTEGVEHVEYSLPNKHFFEIDLSWHKGLKNTGEDAEVYAPQSNPNGLIKCRVSRNVKSKL